jgi:septal ring factor EnvC (AmiA/AmiB activator)
LRLALGARRSPEGARIADTVTNMDSAPAQTGDEVAAPSDRDQEIARLNAELEETRIALAAAEQQLLELRDRRSTEMARLERQAHWVERSRIDLDRLMSRRSVRALILARQLVLRLRGFVLALLRR